MQLDPHNQFAPQIAPLSGQDFENIVASCYLYLGYFVTRNLSVLFEKQSAAEIDVLASLITPMNEVRIAIECKGQTPSFNDLRKFATTRAIIEDSYSHLSLVAYGASSIRTEHLGFAKKMNVTLLRKDDLSKNILPILWADGQLRQDRIVILNRYLAIFSIQDFLLKDTFSLIGDIEIKRMIARYKKYLYQELWAISDPVAQIEDAFDKAQGEFNGFTASIAAKLGVNLQNQLDNPTNPIIQLAMFLELEHRVFNLYGIARCSILARTDEGRELIVNRTPSIRDAINDLCDHNASIGKFGLFIFRFIYLWGAQIKKDAGFEEFEYEQMANECGISKENAKSFVRIIYNVYSSGGNLFHDDAGVFFMKYVPAAFRGLGRIHRESIDLARYNGQNVLFPVRETANRGMCNTCLNRIGGIAGLRFG